MCEQGRLDCWRSGEESRVGEEGIALNLLFKNVGDDACVRQDGGRKHRKESAGMCWCYRGQGFLGKGECKEMVELWSLGDEGYSIAGK